MSSDSFCGYPLRRCLVVVLCFLALGLNFWLTYQKWSGGIDSLAGCGKGSDCSNILGSRWSVVFGRIPVSLPSFFVYLALMLSLWRSSIGARYLQLVIAWVLAGAAVWFIGLQAFLFEGFCKYCMTIHSIGLLVALAIVWTYARGHRRDVWIALPVGAVAVILLVLIQVFGPVPASHRVDTVDGAGGRGGVHAAGEGRLVRFLGGNKAYRVESLPHLGDAGAKHVLVKYFDYTCDSCRKVDGYLEVTLEQYPDDVAVIVLPAPLSRRCNAHLPAEVKDHDKACEMARCALAVWRAAPKQFAAFHHWLMRNSDQSVAEVEAEAKRRVGTDAYQVAQEDAWIDEVIRQNAEDYRVLIQATPVMPKLLLGGNSVLQGVSADAGSFVFELKKYLKIGR